MGFVFHRAPSTSSAARSVLAALIHLDPVAPRLKDRWTRLGAALTVTGEELLTGTLPCRWDDRFWPGGLGPGHDGLGVVDLRESPAPVRGLRP